MMKTAIVDYFGYDLSPRERMQAIRRGGFDGVILLWTDQFDPDYRDFPRYAQEEGLYVENAHGPYLGANEVWLPGEAGESYTLQLITALQEYAQASVPTLVVHPVNGRQALPQDPSLGLERFRRVLRTAESCGVAVAMENQGNPDYLDLVFAQLASPQLKFCYDSGHENYFSPQRDLLAQYGHLLAALHLHDNPGTSDLHALPMTGTVDWPRVAQRLHQSGYPGALALEARNAGFTHLTDPVAFLQEAHARLERLAGMMAE